jgi:hypothetical protein
MIMVFGVVNEPLREDPEGHASPEGAFTIVFWIRFLHVSRGRRPAAVQPGLAGGTARPPSGPVRLGPIRLGLLGFGPLGRSAGPRNVGGI